MRAVVVSKPGGPEVLEPRTLGIPSVKPGWILIKVEAFGLNRAELHARAGYSGPSILFPRVIGIECVGTIVKSDVERLPCGETVVAMMNGMGRAFDGSYAEYTCVPEKCCHLVKKPDGMTWKTLAALPEMFQTTNGSLKAGLNCRKGETILIRGGTSSIGLCAIVLGKQMGLTVLATTRSHTKSAALLEAGADGAIIDDGSIQEAEIWWSRQST